LAPSFHAHETGTGKSLLILHGFLGGARQFLPLADALGTQFHCLIPDLPGHGLTPWDPKLTSLAQLADQLYAWVTSRTNGPVQVLGHSMGGYIAAALAARHPGAVSQLHLLHSTTFPDTPQRQQDRNRALTFIARHGTRPYIRAFMQKLFHAPEEAWTKDALSHAERIGEAALTGYLAMMRDRPGYTEALSAQPLETRFLIGVHDGIVPPERNREEVTKMVGATAVALPAAGHMAMYEDFAGWVAWMEDRPLPDQPSS